MWSASLKFFPFLLSVLMALADPFLPPGSRAQGSDKGGGFVVTGHILNKKVEIGINEEFKTKGIPFINRIHPDFLILTGDVVFGDDAKSGERLPTERIRRKYDYVANSVFNVIEAPVYTAAGNHDTGWMPHSPSIEIFEERLNPLRFSFEHMGSLFLFLSPYHPFRHTELGPFFPLKRFDTPSSRAFLGDLRRELKGGYDHVFVFVHFSPVNDSPIGYYWNHYLIPLLSPLGKDVHIFSTDQGTRRPLIYNTDRVVRHDNVSFYCFAQFPAVTYLVNFDDHSVKVDLLQGSTFTPVSLKEVDFTAVTRGSMLRRYLSMWLISVPTMLIKYYYFKYFKKSPKALVKQYFQKMLKKFENIFGSSFRLTGLKHAPSKQLKWLHPTLSSAR